jgi:hypothetical protein
MMAMWTSLMIGVGIVAIGNTPPQQQVAARVLVVGSASLDIVDGRPKEVAQIKRRWDPQLKHNVEAIGDVEFVMGKAFWEMVDKNNALYSAKSDLQVTASQELLYRGMKVDVGTGVKYVDTALHWAEWVVLVAGLTNPKGPERLLRGKGGPWYLVWFSSKTLKGSYQFLSSVVAEPLRIYSR